MLVRQLPMAVVYDPAALDPASSAIADRLRKQAKTRAIKLLREVRSTDRRDVISPTIDIIGPILDILRSLSDMLSSRPDILGSSYQTSYAASSAIADRLRKQAKTRAIRLLREVRPNDVIGPIIDIKGPILDTL